jgi:hypothetical protein
MTASPSHAGLAVDKRNLQLVQDKLAHTLDMLDYYGVSGVITVCLFPDDASYLTSGGTCVDLHGAAMGLYAGLTGIRDLAKARGEDALLATINEAVHALAPVLRAKDNGGVH